MCPRYLEASAKTGHNVKAVFQEVANKLATGEMGLKAVPEMFDVKLSKDDPDTGHDSNACVC